MSWAGKHSPVKPPLKNNLLIRRYEMTRTATGVPRLVVAGHSNWRRTVETSSQPCFEVHHRLSWLAACRPRGFLRHCCDVRMGNEVRGAMPGEAEAGY